MVDLIKMENFADHVLIILITVTEKCSIILFLPRKYLKHIDQTQGEVKEAFLPAGNMIWAWLRPVKFTTTLSYVSYFSRPMNL